jgi:hypothetical protein
MKRLVFSLSHVALVEICFRRHHLALEEGVMITRNLQITLLNKAIAPSSSQLEIGIEAKGAADGGHHLLQKHLSSSQEEGRDWHRRMMNSSSNSTIDFKCLLQIELSITHITQEMTRQEEEAVAYCTEELPIEAEEVGRGASPLPTCVGDGAGESQSKSVFGHGKSHQLVIAWAWAKPCGFESR